jgi:membrane protein required for colicin V production
MLTAFDVGFGVLLLISAILATARGLTREVLSLVTWAGSAAIAAYMYFKHPEIAQGYIKDTLVANVATVAVSFIISLIILHLITMRIADFVVDSRIGPLDRTLGFVFGILRGVVIAVVVVIFGLWLYTNQLPGSQQLDYSKLPAWAAESKSLPFLQNIGGELLGALPADLEGQITGFLKHNNGNAPAVTDDSNGEDSTDASPDDTSPNDATPAPDNAAPDAGAPAGGNPAPAPAGSAT